MGNLEPAQNKQISIEQGGPSVGDTLRTEALIERALLDGKMDFRMINNLHMFPSTQICQACMDSAASVSIARKDPPGSEAVDARSVLSILTLGAPQGTVLTVSVQGEGAADIWGKFFKLQLWAAEPEER